MSSPSRIRESLPPLATTATIVVYERAPHWSVAARQMLQPAKVAEVRTLEDAWGALQSAPYSGLLLEVEPQRAPQMVSLLVRVQTELPAVMSIACVAEASPAWELLLREAGAALVLRAPRRLQQVSAWLLRHLAAAPQEKSSTRQRLWNQLPWPEAATAPPIA